MNGILYGVGVGPGDPELITLKAVRIIKECHMLAIPAQSKEKCTAYSIALGAVPEISDKPVIYTDIPMTKDMSVLSQAYEKGAEAIKKHLAEGRDIAFLTLGDPTVYSTYMVFHDNIISCGFEARIINGIPSFCAAAARLGTSLGSRNENIHILPASYNSGDIQALDGTRVLMKSGRRLKELKQGLSELEKQGRIKSVAVSNCGMPAEKVYKDIELLDENSGYFTTVIVKDK